MILTKGIPPLDPGVFGDFLCDSPYHLILSAFSYMKQADLQPEFIIWTGNSPPNVPKEELSTYVVINVIANMTHLTLVLPTAASLSCPGQPRLLATGISIPRATKVLSWEFKLNTNLYYSPNQVTVNMTDPTGQFQWLQETLELSRQKMEMVYVIAHVPIGYLPYAINTTAVRESYHEQLVKIFHNYSDFVKAQFYGHPHRDMSVLITWCVLIKVPAQSAIASLLIITLSLFFPPKDIWQFYLNLTEANLKQRSKWKLEHIMTEAFDIDDIQLHSLHELYFNNFMVSYNLNLTCEGLCKMIRVCALHFLDQETYSQYCDGRQIEREKAPYTLRPLTAHCLR
uniref:Sphingomyelin phosphodiesterase acid like 3A n=1 Tax=Cyprinus carpio TaxID=7962 RepID=A0A8C1W0K8_CYPCA